MDRDSIYFESDTKFFRIRIQYAFLYRGLVFQNCCTFVETIFLFVMSNESLLKSQFIAPDTPFESFPFDEIDESKYADLIKYAIAKQRESIKKISQNTEQATFENTILALENASADLDAILGAFYAKEGAASNDLLMTIDEELSPLLSELGSEILFDDQLFKRIQEVYDQRDTLQLDLEDDRLLYRTYRYFYKGGATLDKPTKQMLADARKQLSQATLSFGQNMLKDAKLFRFFLPLSTPWITALPQSIQATARERAYKERKVEGFLFSLDPPETSAIMKFCPDRKIREIFFRAKMTVGYCNNCYNNVEWVRKIANLRLKIAQIMGYKNYAQYALQDRMLKTPEQVLSFVDSLNKASRHKSLDELDEAAHLSEVEQNKLAHWDINFAFELLRKAKYDFSSEELRPYFPLSTTITGVFGLASRLYDITFLPESSVQVYAPDIKVYRVEDKNTSEYLGLIYLDFFPREGKRSGAWMTNFREQKKDHRPHILLVMNFTPPVGEREALLSADEVHTFLHEFGHALHGMLSQGKYASLSGTNVVQDFVELPSQINENWLLEKEFLKTFAHHYQTGEELPDEILQKFISTGQFATGYATQRQLAFCILDMAFHTIETPLPEDFDLETFEEHCFSQTPGFGKLPSGCVMSTAFSHLFSGGYAAGYYSYKWSEVLSCDAYSLFTDRGIFDKNTAMSFRQHILEKGDSEEAMLLYQRFRGRVPQIDALIKRDGLY